MNNLKLEYLIKKKGKSKRNAAIEMGMNLSTLNNILDREIESATGKNLLLLSNYLNITVDELLKNDEIVETKIKMNEINLLLNRFNINQLDKIKNIIINITEIKEN